MAIEKPSTSNFAHLAVNGKRLPILDGRKNRSVLERYRTFVYGTLQPGGHYFPTYCQGRSTIVGRAKIRGRLYHLPVGYPALASGREWVHGWVLNLHSRETLEAIDQLEGYSPKIPQSWCEYRRFRASVFTLDGKRWNSAWAYRMDENRILAMRGRYLPSGQWPNSKL